MTAKTDCDIIRMVVKWLREHGGPGVINNYVSQIETNPQEVQSPFTCHRGLTVWQDEENRFTVKDKVDNVLYQPGSAEIETNDKNKLEISVNDFPQIVRLTNDKQDLENGDTSDFAATQRFVLSHTVDTSRYVLLNPDNEQESYLKLKPLNEQPILISDLGCINVKTIKTQDAEFSNLCKIPDLNDNKNALDIAANKQYVDKQNNDLKQYVTTNYLTEIDTETYVKEQDNLVKKNITEDVAKTYIPKTGTTEVSAKLTGSLIVPKCTNQSESLAAATKEYVDSHSDTGTLHKSENSIQKIEWSYDTPTSDYYNIYSYKNKIDDETAEQSYSPLYCKKYLGSTVWNYPWSESKYVFFQHGPNNALKTRILKEYKNNDANFQVKLMPNSQFKQGSLTASGDHRLEIVSSRPSHMHTNGTTYYDRIFEYIVGGFSFNHSGTTVTKESLFVDLCINPFSGAIPDIPTEPYALFGFMMNGKLNGYIALTSYGIPYVYQVGIGAYEFMLRARAIINECPDNPDFPKLSDRVLIKRQAIKQIDGKNQLCVCLSEFQRFEDGTQTLIKDLYIKPIKESNEDPESDYYNRPIDKTKIVKKNINTTKSNDKKEIAPNKDTKQVKEDDKKTEKSTDDKKTEKSTDDKKTDNKEGTNTMNEKTNEEISKDDTDKDKDDSEKDNKPKKDSGNVDSMEDYQRRQGIDPRYIDPRSMTEG